MKIVTKHNFLNDPDHARELASTGDKDNCADYTEYHYNDLKTTELRNTEHLQKIFSELLEEDVILIDNEVRKFNICLERPDDKVHIHHDDVDYIGIVYLNEPSYPTDGTLIVRHKETGIFYKDEEKFGTQLTMDGDVNSDSFDLSKWQTELFIPMEYNKLVIFEPRHYHTETRTFGKDLTDGRCVEIFHIIKKDRIEYWKEFYKEDIESGDYELPEEFR